LIAVALDAAASHTHICGGHEVSHVLMHQSFVVPGATLKQLLASFGTKGVEPEPSAHLGSGAGLAAGSGVAETAFTGPESLSQAHVAGGHDSLHVLMHQASSVDSMIL
jgi:hypothetical protein